MEARIPKNGYAFVPKNGGDPILTLFLGDWDSIDNYKEISRAEYEAICEASRRESQSVLL